MGARSRSARDSSRRTGDGGGGPTPPGGESITFWTSPIVHSAAAANDAIPDVYFYPSLAGLAAADLITPGASFRSDVGLRNLRFFYRQVGAPSIGDGELTIDSPSIGTSFFLGAPDPNGTFLDLDFDDVLPAEEAIRIFGVWNQTAQDGARVQAILTMELVRVSA